MQQGRNRIVPMVGAFKLLKAAVLITVGVVGMVAAPKRVAEWAGHTAAATAIYPGVDTIRHAIGEMWALDRKSEEKLGVLALAYAAVFLVEGVGLLARRRWAEWLTVVVTTSFIPLEVYELVQKASVTKVVALTLNVAIVVYLLWWRLNERRGGAAKRSQGERKAA